MNPILSKAYNGAILLGIIFLAVSCNKGPDDPGMEYMPDMYRTVAYKAYSPSGMFNDSTSSRLPVAGTIPRGYTFFHYPSTSEGYEASGRDLKNPFEVNAQNLKDGQKLYSNFCMHCHGATGNADGSLIATGKYPPPPSYITGVSSRGGKVRDLSEGKIFHTITYGINLMGPHASLVNPEERWKITMYVKNQLMNAVAPADSGEVPATTSSADTTIGRSSH